MAVFEDIYRAFAQIDRKFGQLRQPPRSARYTSKDVVAPLGWFYCVTNESAPIDLTIRDAVTIKAWVAKYVVRLGTDEDGTSKRSGKCYLIDCDDIPIERDRIYPCLTAVWTEDPDENPPSGKIHRVLWVIPPDRDRIVEEKPGATYQNGIADGHILYRVANTWVQGPDCKIRKLTKIPPPEPPPALISGGNAFTTEL